MNSYDPVEQDRIAFENAEAMANLREENIEDETTYRMKNITASELVNLFQEVDVEAIESGHIKPGSCEDLVENILIAIRAMADNKQDYNTLLEDSLYTYLWRNMKECEVEPVHGD